jgi:hypothetical protein
MRIRYTDIELLPDVLMTDKDGIYTSGGALLSWNLVLYLIEKFVSREVAIGVSKMFNIDLDKGRQSHFTVFNGQRSHDDEGQKQRHEEPDQARHSTLSGGLSGAPGPEDSSHYAADYAAQDQAGPQGG